MSIAQEKRTTGPAELAGKWALDPAHTRLGFAARHLMVTTVRGKFNDLTGWATLDPENPAASELSVTIQAASVDTGSADRDAHLRSPDFFDVENYPTIEFHSTDIRPTDDPNEWIVVGDLTIRGVTKPVEIRFTYLGVTSPDPWGGTRAGFEGTAKVNRKDWNLVWNRTLEHGGVLVGDEVKLELDIQAVKQD